MVTPTIPIITDRGMQHVPVPDYAGEILGSMSWQGFLFLATTKGVFYLDETGAFRKLAPPQPPDGGHTCRPCGAPASENCRGNHPECPRNKEKNDV